MFNKHMNMLLSGERVDMPVFYFKIGRKEYGTQFLQLGKDDILVIEGIHCLNDELSYALPVESKFKIYISALTQLNVDEQSFYDRWKTYKKNGKRSQNKRCVCKENA